MGPDKPFNLFYTQYGDVITHVQMISQWTSGSLNFFPCFSFCCCFILWLHSVGFLHTFPAPPVIMRFSWTDRKEEDMFVFWQHPKDSLNKCMTGVTLFHLSVWPMSPVLSCDWETHCYLKSFANYNLKYRLKPLRLICIKQMAFKSKCIYCFIKRANVTIIQSLKVQNDIHIWIVCR